MALDEQALRENLEECRKVYYECRIDSIGHVGESVVRHKGKDDRQGPK